MNLVSIIEQSAAMLVGCPDDDVATAQASQLAEVGRKVELLIEREKLLIAGLNAARAEFNAFTRGLAEAELRRRAGWSVADMDEMQLRLAALTSADDAVKEIPACPDSINSGYSR